jgi:hypothetical protein
MRSTGREIGFDSDFLVPAYGDVEVEVVRYRTLQGLRRAYSYFLQLPARHDLRAVPLRSLGEQAALVVGIGAAYIEFRRDRYYVVVTVVPPTGSSLSFITQVSKSVDRRIRQSLASA